MIFKDPIPSQPFAAWLFKTKENKILLMVSTMVIILQFVVFKIWYPFPNFFPDSYEYIAGAIENRVIDYRPIGYTKFLQLFHFVTSSHLALIWFQYLLLQASILYLLFTIRYLLQPGKWVFCFIMLGCILNPLVPHVSNFVSSDPLFTAFSLIWFTQLLWITARPTMILLLLHAVVLLLAFVVRYNAIYYPAVSILFIIFSQARLRSKLVSISFIVILLGLFVGFTKHHFKEKTGFAQFSPFSGWQLVANALEGYTHTSELVGSASVPEKFRALHGMVNAFMDSLRRIPHEKQYETAPYYLWGDQSPLSKYMNSHWSNDSTTQFIRWATISPLYEEYGRYLIKQHWALYFKYHILVNLELYHKPFMEYLGIYNSSGQQIGPEAVHWFRLTTNKINSYYKDTRIHVSKAVVIFNGIIHWILIFAFIGFLGLTGFNKSSAAAKQFLWRSLFVWLCNLGFSLMAAPVVLRYQVFQITITFIWGVLLIEFIVREYQSMQIKHKLTTNVSVARTGISA